MNANQEQGGASFLHGNLLRLGEQHEIAIYMRDGMAWVADFKDGRCKVSTASAWFASNQDGRVLHRMDLGSITPLPEEVVERIERLHQRMTKAGDHRLMSRAVATLGTGFRGWLARLSAPPRSTASESRNFTWSA